MVYTSLAKLGQTSRVQSILRYWSEYEDLNLGFLAPKASDLPD